ncbi:MAG: helix-turn-helix domain-containing protein [Bacteroidota bacterium]
MIKQHQYFDINDKVIIERILYQPPLSKHTPMPDEACLMYNLSGATKVYSPMQNEVIGEEECVLLKCGQYFTSTLNSEKNEDFETVVVHFYPDILQAVFANNLPNYIPEAEEVSDSSKAINRVRVNKFLRNYIDSILLLFENPSLVTEELILLKVREVILMLLNTKSEEAEKIKKILSNLFSPTKVSLKKVVDAHAYDNLALEQLAKLCNMSLSNFKRRFFDLFGESPAAYIRKKKLEKAAHLLKSSNMPIASICYETGFSDTSNFTKTFRSHFKSTPSKYRNKYSLK